jgi:hypothetical protein
MVGTWKVQQRMWPGFGAQAIDLPTAIARRHLLTGGFLEEVMEPAKKSGKESFNRTAYFNYNTVTQRYEYFSLDSRAPQMMNERSERVEEQSEPGTIGREPQRIPRFRVCLYPPALTYSAPNPL